MSRHVNSIAGRLSLRAPQREALEILDRVTEIVAPSKATDVDAALQVIRSEYPSLTEFERDFPSLCFALAAGVGKTRLMGAFITYLHLAHGIDNFFVLAPNLTIYRKLITDFTPNTPKYVFKGIAEFATAAPEIITGDDYEMRASTLFDRLVRCKINIFNISKITSEVRGGRAPRIKRLSEYIGESYFEYLAVLPDLVLIMDESHRYRASAGVKAINELKPVLGLELTATPFTESSRGPVQFKNVVLDYPLGRAMADGFVKEPAVVTRRNFNAAGMSADEIERLKLEDGIRLHESVKVELETYARQMDRPVVKPFVLVIARDTTHAAALLAHIESEAFFEGRYCGKAIQVDSSRSGAEEEVMIERLLRVEHADEPTEIVIHVNMLKEGWDVTNLYTIIPLRAANARTLIEQSIGRGLRLPYGVRTGVPAVDRLNIVAHDRFQEIVDEAGRPNSPIRMTSVVLDERELDARTTSVASPSRLDAELGLAPAAEVAQFATDARVETTPLFSSPEEQRVAQITHSVIRRLSTRPDLLPDVAHLERADIRAEIARIVEAEYAPRQIELDIATQPMDVVAIVAKTAERIGQRMISIPRILLVPTGDVSSRFEPFQLELSNLRYPPVSEDLWIRHLRTGQTDVLALNPGGVEEKRAEDYVVSGLVGFNDVSYDDHADLLYDLAGQVVRHLESYLSDEDARRVLRYHQREIATFVHTQMVPHFREKSTGGYEVVVSRGMTDLKPSAYTATVREGVVDYRFTPTDKGNIAKYLFAGFTRCLYDVQKFDSDPERKFAVILERDALKWMRPARGQFQIFYGSGGTHNEYQPDFVAETDREILMVEVKARRDLEDPDVVSKQSVARDWCGHATAYSTGHGGKPWRYVMIPHDAVVDNAELGWLADRFSLTSAN